MSSTPDLNEDLLKKDVDTYAALASVANSEGGRVLLKNMASDILARLGLVTAGYATLPEHELRAHCADLNTKIDMYRALSNAQQNFLDAKEELDKILTE